MPSNAFLTAEWRHLVVVNYQVEPGLLHRHVPPGTELSLWHGTAFLSLVAFRFLRTKILGLPVPFHRDFEELNLRTYVRRTTGANVRRGVVFLKEVVPLPAVALAARVLYNEPYSVLPMRSRVDAGPPPDVNYEWRLRGRWHRCGARGSGEGSVPGDGSFEQFIVEQEWGYTRQRDGSTTEYRVEHPRWTVWPATDLRIDADLEALYGPVWAKALVQPHSAFVVDGSAVRVARPLPALAPGNTFPP